MTAIDDADVVVVNPAIQLSKVAEPSAVLFGEDQTEQAGHLQVHRHQPRRGTAEPARRRGGGPGTKDPGWVEDVAPDPTGSWAAATRRRPTMSGDANDNEMLDPGEEWEFTCPGTVTGRRRSTSRRSSVSPRTRTAAPFPASTRSRTWRPPSSARERPGITITKTALRDPVLDPDATAVSGPDVPDPRPAEYTYEVTNTGTVPLALNPTRRSTTSAARSCLPPAVGRHQRRRAARHRARSGTTSARPPWSDSRRTPRP